MKFFHYILNEVTTDVTEGSTNESPNIKLPCMMGLAVQMNYTATKNVSDTLTITFNLQGSLDKGANWITVSSQSVDTVAGSVLLNAANMYAPLFRVETEVEFGTLNYLQTWSYGKEY